MGSITIVTTIATPISTSTSTFPQPASAPVPVARSSLARAAALWVVVAAAASVAGCAGPLPALHWVRLPAEPLQPVVAVLPGQATLPVTTSPSASTAHALAAVRTSAVWQLVAPVGLPGYLDRDPLLVPQGRAGLQPLGGARWAEPLREAVTRLLRQDLARALGTEVWTSPLPPGLRPTQQLRIELLAFDITPDASGVALQARWSLADAAGNAAPRWEETAFITPSAAADADALAVAHRQALAVLAGRVAASAAR